MPAASFARLVLAVQAIALSVASVASADVVFPPPSTCPPGAVAETMHGGPFCRASECASVADCARYRDFAGVCAPAGLCVREQSLFGGRGRRVPMQVALGSCRIDAECPDGITCVRVDRCVADGSTEGPVAPRFVPSVPWSAGSCGAMGLIALITLAGAGVLFQMRRTDRAARDEAVRAWLVTHGRARRAELAASDADIARALAPIATRVRVEIDDEGEPVYAIDETSEDERSA